MYFLLDSFIYLKKRGIHTIFPCIKNTWKNKFSICLHKQIHKLNMAFVCAALGNRILCCHDLTVVVSQSLLQICDDNLWMRVGFL